MHINYTRPPLTGYQRAILDSPARYTVTFASTKSGKTASHIVWLFEQALRLKKGQSVWWVAPVYQQAEIAYSRMKRQVLSNMGGQILIANETKLRLTLPTGGMIQFKSADNPDNLYGDDVYAAVFDEFSRAKEAAWYALRSTLTKTQAKCKLIGNVKGRKNWAWKVAERAKGGEDGYEYHKITAWDAVAAGILSREEIEQAEKDLPAHVFAELYLCEPTEDGSNPFGNIDHCIAPMSRDKVACYGVDLAKYTDWTVIIGLDSSGNVAYFDRYREDWQQTKADVIKVIGRTPAFIDSTGVGDPIVEDIQRACPNVRGFKYTATSKQQIMEQLAAAVHGGEVHFPDGAISDEMRNFEFSYSGNGVKYSAPVGLHDDCVNALALAVDCKKRNKPGLFAWA